MLRLVRSLPFTALILASGAAAAPLATTVAAPTVAPSPVLHLASDGGGDCGWFTILASARSYSGAQRAAARARSGVNIINTNSVPEFTSGLFVAAYGPNSESAARAHQRQARHDGFADAYVKFGCEYY